LQGEKSVSVHLVDAKIDLAHLPNWRELASRGLRGVSHGGVRRIDVTVGKATIASPYEFAVPKVKGTIQKLGPVTQADFHFQLAQSEGSQPVHIRLVRHEEEEGSSLAYGIHTGSAQLPCRVLAKAVPAFAELGAASTFQGFIWVHTGADGPTGQLAGRWTEVPLSGISSQFLGHRLEGHAIVHLEMARFEAGQVTEARGYLEVGPGRCSASLIYELSRQMAMPAVPLRLSPEQVVSFTQLAVGFSWDRFGVRITGRCSGTSAGIVLRDQAGPILAQPAVQSVPFSAVVNALVGPEGDRVPASGRAIWLLQWLPLDGGSTTGSDTRMAANPR